MLHFIGWLWRGIEKGGVDEGNIPVLTSTPLESEHCTLVGLLMTQDKSMNLPQLLPFTEKVQLVPFTN